jgi:Arc/MetJ family transcription regulator
VTKRLIDVDDELLGSAREVLGAKTMKETVNEALRAVTSAARRREHVARLAADGLPDLRDQAVMDEAWR